MTLQGRVALVSGATTGIGRATARALAAAGAAGANNHLTPAAAAAALVRGLVELDRAPLVCLGGDRARVFAGLAPWNRVVADRVEGIGFCGIDELLRGSTIRPGWIIPGGRWLLRDGDDLRLCRMEWVEGRWVPSPEEPLPEEPEEAESLRIPLPLDGTVLELDLDGGLPMLHRAVRRYDRAERLLCALVASEEGFTLERVKKDAKTIGSLLASGCSGRVFSRLREQRSLAELRRCRNIMHHALRSPRGSRGQIAAFARRLHGVAQGLGWEQWRWCAGGVHLPDGPLRLSSHWVLQDPSGGALVYDTRAGCYRDTTNQRHAPEAVAQRVGQPVSGWLREVFEPMETAPTTEFFRRR
jgi:hypothetical protein